LSCASACDVPARAGWDATKLPDANCNVSAWPSRHAAKLPRGGAVASTAQAAHDASGMPARQNRHAAEL
jgi:hypothetical protein